LKIAKILLGFERRNGPIRNQMGEVIRGNFIIILFNSVQVALLRWFDWIWLKYAVDSRMWMISWSRYSTQSGFVAFSSNYYITWLCCDFNRIL